MYFIDRTHLKSDAKFTVLDRSYGLLFTTAVYILLTEGLSDVLHFFLPNPIGEVLNSFSAVMQNIADKAASGLVTDPDLTPAYAAAARTIQELLTQPVKQAILFLFLLLFLYQLVMSFGYNALCLRSAREERLEWTALFDVLGDSSRILLLALLTNALTFLGFFFFVLPGLMAFYGLRFAPFLLAEHSDWSVFRCIAESWRMTSGHKFNLFMLDLSFIGWELLCFTLSNVGYEIGATLHPLAAIVLSLVSFLALAVFYLPYKTLTIVGYMDAVKDLVSKPDPLNE